MKAFILVNKPVGLSPLQAITRVRKLCPHYRSQKIGYAGRLDPMAEGLLLLLIGDENKRRRTYELLNKEYEFEMLLGIASDSYDSLGLITKVVGDAMRLEEIRLRITDIFGDLQGTFSQPYPPYSSARVNGKPLYYWARAGRLSEIRIPKKNITISRLRLNHINKIKLVDVYPTVIERIRLVSGEFRQEAILNKWNEVLSNNSQLKLTKISATISCSSGTYVRSVANTIGTRLGVGAIALSIKRIKIGNYSLEESLSI